MSDSLHRRLLHTNSKFEAADISKLASILLDIVLQVRPVVRPSTKGQGVTCYESKINSMIGAVP